MPTFRAYVEIDINSVRIDLIDDMIDALKHRKEVIMGSQPNVEEIDLIHDGRTIDAIKAIRARLGLSLGDAKWIVDQEFTKFRVREKENT